jgi:hypothetical protein
MGVDGCLPPVPCPAFLTPFSAFPIKKMTFFILNRRIGTFFLCYIWYQTGENELEEGAYLEATLLAEWDWDFGMTLYQENINKTMVIKFIKSEDGKLYKDDWYVYLQGEWYFIEGKL